MSEAVPAWRRQSYNLAALRELARRALPHPIFDFADGGAEDERTLRRNEAAFGDISLIPRPLNGAATRDISVELFGARLSLPVVLIAVFGTSSIGRAGPALASTSERRNRTLTPMSGRIRGSSCLKPTRTSTVAFWRSAVGIIVITCAGISQSG